jgi:hypothetical protein
MGLYTTIQINRQILKLIASKYTELFPAGYSTREARYYKALDRDTQQAIDALVHGGLALPPKPD